MNARKNLPLLEVIFRDAKVRLDNNLAENALRIVGLERKNFLFTGPGENGHHLAALLTIVSTCKAEGINPEEYIDTLLPMNWGKAVRTR